MIYVKELELRYKRHAVDVDGPLGKKVASAEMVYKLFSYLQDVPQEVFLAVHLDSRNKVMSYRQVSAGNLSANIVDPAEVLRGALLAGARRFIAVHNHPGGDPTPSTQDMEFTERLRRAGEIVGVTMEDHIIIGDGCYTSFRDGWHVTGYLPTQKKDSTKREGDMIPVMGTVQA